MKFQGFTKSLTVGMLLGSLVGLNACSKKESPATFAALAETGPLVTIVDPPEGTYITQANYENFTLNGFCSENGSNVIVQTDVPVMGVTTCLNNSWQVSLDVSFLFDGPLTFTVNHATFEGAAPTFERTYIKDTLAPTNPSIVIGDGSTVPTSPNVTLQLFAQGATQMYITNTPGCSTNGQLLPYSTTANWVLQPVNGVATVYAQFLDDAGNKTACVNDSTPVDIAPPPTVAIHFPAAGTIINAANAGNFRLAGTCSENGRAVLINPTNTSVTCTANAWEAFLNLTSVPDGNVTFTVIHIAADEQEAQATASYLKDATLPTVAILTPPAGTIINETNQAAFTVTGSCSENGRSVVVSGTASATVTCTANAWTSTLNFTSAPEGTILVLADHSDAAGNAAIQASRQFTKKLTVNPSPSPSVTPPPAGGSTRLVFDGPIKAIGIDADGHRYYGGNFTRVAGAMARGMIQLDAAGNASALLDLKLGFNGPVHAILPLADGSFIAGGNFTTYRKLAARGIARLSSTGELDTTFSPQSGSNGFEGVVHALALDPQSNTVFVGGDFKRYRGSPVSGLTKLTLTGSLDPAFQSSSQDCVDAAVYAIVVHNGAAVIGGNFKSYRGSSARGIARINAANGALDTAFCAGNGFDGTVLALAIDQNAIYAGGDFDRYRSSPARSLAKLAHTGALDLTFSPSSGANGVSGDKGIVKALALSSDSLYVGGEFEKVRGMTAKNLAKVSLAGDLDTTFNPSSGDNGTSGTVLGLRLDNGSLFAVGTFSRYRSVLRNGIAKINAETGALDTGFNSSGLGFSREGRVPPVKAVAFSAGRILVAGDLLGSLYHGVVAERLAKVLSTGQLDTAFAAAVKVNAVVDAIAVSARTIYFGGDFTSVTGMKANRIAKINQAGALDLTFNPQSGQNGFDRTVRALAATGDTVYAGGDFKSYRGSQTTRVAKLASSGALVQLTGCREGFNRTVRALALTEGGSILYVGGAFSSYDGKKANHIAKLSTASFNLDTEFNPQSGMNHMNGTDDEVHALAADPITTQVYAGGLFRSYRGQKANKIVRIRSNGTIDTAFDADVESTGSTRFLASGDSHRNDQGHGHDSHGKGHGFGHHKDCGHDLSTVDAIAVESTGARLVIGGRMHEVNDQYVNHVALLSRNGQVDPVFSPQAAPHGVDLLYGEVIPVQALAIGGPKIHIGGNFTSYRDTPLLNLAVTAFNGSLAE